MKASMELNAIYEYHVTSLGKKLGELAKEGWRVVPGIVVGELILMERKVI